MGAVESAAWVEKAVANNTTASDAGSLFVLIGDWFE
jgi:hypothetical protein